MRISTQKRCRIAQLADAKHRRAHLEAKDTTRAEIVYAGSGRVLREKWGAVCDFVDVKHINSGAVFCVFTLLTNYFMHDLAVKLKSTAHFVHKIHKAFNPDGHDMQTKKQQATSGFKTAPLQTLVYFGRQLLPITFPC